VEITLEGDASSVGNGEAAGGYQAFVEPAIAAIDARLATTPAKRTRIVCIAIAPRTVTDGRSDYTPFGVIFKEYGDRFGTGWR
jgi:hypothetical protein